MEVLTSFAELSYSQKDKPSPEGGGFTFNDIIILNLNHNPMPKFISLTLHNDTRVLKINVEHIVYYSAEKDREITLIQLTTGQVKVDATPNEIKDLIGE